MCRTTVGFFAVAVVAFTACGGGSGGGKGDQKITDEQLCQFRYGTTTPSEVIEALGEPTSRASGGTTSLVYEYGAPQDADWLQTHFVFGGVDDLLAEVMRVQSGSVYGPVPTCLDGP